MNTETKRRSQVAAVAIVFYIVAANYRDRKSPYKWLVRKENEPIEKARACKKVELTNATFIRSNESEEGFGCRVVCRCETAKGTQYEPRTVKLEFDGAHTFYDKNKNAVEHCDTLVLDETGGITGTLSENDD